MFFSSLWFAQMSHHQIPHTTARVGVSAGAMVDLEFKIYSEKAVRSVDPKVGSAPEEFDSCAWIDRRAGEEFTFSFQLEGDNYPLPLSPEHLDVS